MLAINKIAGIKFIFLFFDIFNVKKITMKTFEQ